MCLTIARSAHPKLLPRIATRPLIVRKDVFVVSKGRYRSPYYSSTKSGAGFWKDGVMSKVTTLTKGGRNKYVHKGLHSALPSRHRVGSKRLWAVIPAGAKFFLGMQDDLVSDKLIVFLNEAEMKKYLGITGDLPPNVSTFCDVDSFSVLIDKKK